MNIPKINYIESCNTNFDHLTPENEINKPKINDNLRNHISFLDEDIFLNEKSIIIDCGANIGDITSIFAQYNAQVYSFEPTASTFNILQNRFSKHNNVKCFKKAIWNKNVNIPIYHHVWSKYNEIHWSNGNSLLKGKINVNENDYEIVEAIDFVEFIKLLNKNIDLIKIDIEGAEIEVLNYLIDSGIISKVNKILCEVHDKKYKFLKSDTDRLRKKIKVLNLSNKINLEWH